MKRAAVISLIWVAGTFLLFSWLTYSTGDNADTAEELAHTSAEKASEYRRSLIAATNVADYTATMGRVMEENQKSWQLGLMEHRISVTRSRIWIVWLVVSIVPVGYLWWPFVSGLAKKAAAELQERKTGTRPLAQRLGLASFAWVTGVATLMGLFLLYVSNRQSDQMRQLVERHGPLSAPEKGIEHTEAIYSATSLEERMAAYDSYVRWTTGRSEMMGLEWRYVRLRQQAWTIWALAAVLPIVYLWLPFVGALSRQQQAVEDRLASLADG